MKRIFISIVIVATWLSAFGQTKDVKSIDNLLLNGEYQMAVDTCKLILSKDSLNADVYFKLGLAYQNLLSDDKSLDCFVKALTLSPGNSFYKFTVARTLYNRGKLSKAKPALLELYASDSTNWPYASFLTGVYMQEGNSDSAINIYKGFYQNDSSNYVLADKLGFAYLRKGMHKDAMHMYERSLSLNARNLNAIKNLSYLYAAQFGADTAIQLLTKGISIDSTDIDLYTRRASINFTVSRYVEALPDYLKIVGSGDSTLLNLKRTGICSIQRNFRDAAKYLLLAYKKDSTDTDIISNLGMVYRLMGDHKSCIRFYKIYLRRIEPVEAELGLVNLLIAQEYREDNQNKKAVTAFIKSQEYRSDDNVIMIIANLYDEKLNDSRNAIRYYEMWLNKTKKSSDYDPKYIASVKARLEALKNPNPGKLKLESAK
jgi:tetratricopeptide (TPR) repeat protein